MYFNIRFAAWTAINAVFLYAFYCMSWTVRIITVVVLFSGGLLELWFNADFQNWLARARAPSKQHPNANRATCSVPASLPRPGYGLLRSFDMSPSSSSTTPLPPTAAAAAAAATPAVGSSGSGSSAAAAVPSLRVMTWNVERGYELPSIITRLTKLAPDILLLQEVDIDCIRTGNIDVTAEISKALGLPYVYFTTEYFVGSKSEAIHFDPKLDSTGQPVVKPVITAAAQVAAEPLTFDERKTALKNLYGAHGNAILSRYPFLETWSYSLPAARGYYGGLPNDADTEFPTENDPADSADSDDGQLPDPKPARKPHPLCAGSYRAHNTRYVRRATACARIITPSHGVVACASIHLEPNFTGIRGRVRQFHALMANLKGRVKPGDAWVLGGDFNTMGCGYRRWIYKFCCDDLRWNSLGSTEAQYWVREVLGKMYPELLEDPTHDQTTLRILNGVLSDDKLDWLLFSKASLRLLTPAERAAGSNGGGKSKLYGKCLTANGTVPAASAAEQSWAIDGYGSSDHCFVCYDLAAIDS